jgi:hypothetical protein
MRRADRQSRCDHAIALGTAERRPTRTRRRRSPSPTVVKLRPFSVFLDPNDDDLRPQRCLPLLRLAAAIDGCSFVLSVGAADVALRTHRIGTDEHGVYALVSAGSRPSLTGFRVDVEPISGIDEDRAATGSMLVLIRDAAPSSCLAIYFSPDGTTCLMKERNSKD